MDGISRRSREATRKEEVTRILSPAGIVFSVRRAGAKAGVWDKSLTKNRLGNRSNGSKCNSVVVDGTQLLSILQKKWEVAHYVGDRNVFAAFKQSIMLLYYITTYNILTICNTTCSHVNSLELWQRISKRGHCSLTTFSLHFVISGECRNLQELNVSECFNLTVSKTLSRRLIILPLRLSYICLGNQWWRSSSRWQIWVTAVVQSLVWFFQTVLISFINSSFTYNYLNSMKTE